MTESADQPRPALAVDGLDAFYGRSQVAFGVTIAVQACETVAVLGRNGAGKTSALLGIAGVIASRSRRLRLGDRDSRDQRRRAPNCPARGRRKPRRGLR